MKVFAAITAVLLLVPASPAQAYPPTTKTATELQRATLRQTELDFARAFADREAARFATFVAEDARFTGGGKVREGKSAILEQWTKMMQDPDLTLTWSPDIVELSAAGDLGYTSGPYEFTLKRSDGTVARERGRFASVWLRQADGSYRIVFDIGSPEEQPPPKE